LLFCLQIILAYLPFLWRYSTRDCVPVCGEEKKYCKRLFMIIFLVFFSVHWCTVCMCVGVGMSCCCFDVRMFFSLKSDKKWNFLVISVINNKESFISMFSAQVFCWRFTLSQWFLALFSEANEQTVYYWFNWLENWQFCSALYWLQSMVLKFDQLWINLCYFINQRCI